MKYIFLVLSVSIVFTLNANLKHYTLQEAIDKKYLKAEVKSLGGYQAYCMKISLKNVSRESYSVTIEAGRRLNSLDDQYQDILIVKEEVLLLKEGESKVIPVKGYCCQAGNRCPKPEIKYSINKLADSSLVKVAQLLSGNEFDTGAEQDAVWAVSENLSAATITHMNDSVLQPLRVLVAGIKGEALPWYRIVCRKYMSHSGNIHTVPVLLQGELHYSLIKDSYVTLSVRDEKGIPVCLIRTEWLKASSGSVYPLNIPLAGLKKGKYSVELISELGEISGREFVI